MISRFLFVTTNLQASNILLDCVTNDVCNSSVGGFGAPETDKDHLVMQNGVLNLKTLEFSGFESILHNVQAFHTILD